MFSTKAKGVRYLEMAEGYVTQAWPWTRTTRSSAISSCTWAKCWRISATALIPTRRYEKNIGTYGRFDGAAKYIDPVKNNAMNKEDKHNG